MSQLNKYRDKFNSLVETLISRIRILKGDRRVSVTAIISILIAILGLWVGYSMIQPDYEIYYSNPESIRILSQGGLLEEELILNDKHKNLRKYYRQSIVLNASGELDGINISFEPESLVPSGKSIMKVNVSMGAPVGENNIQIHGISDREHYYNYVINVTENITFPVTYRTSILPTGMLHEIVLDKNKLNSSDGDLLLSQIQNANKNGYQVVDDNYDFVIVGYSSQKQENHLANLNSSIDMIADPPAILLYDTSGLYWINYSKFITRMNNEYFEKPN